MSSYGFKPFEKLGKQIGLERIPQLKKMWEKLDILGKEDGVKKWAIELGNDWMGNLPELLSGVLFIGDQVSPPPIIPVVKLPKRMFPAYNCV